MEQGHSCASSGIRLMYAYFEEADSIEFIQIYFKADDENDDRERIKSLMKNELSLGLFFAGYCLQLYN